MPSSADEPGAARPGSVGRPWIADAILEALAKGPKRNKAKTPADDPLPPGLDAEKPEAVGAEPHIPEPDEPGVTRPGSADPDTDVQDTGDPGTEAPGTDAPGVGEVDGETPDEPGVEDPGAEEPADELPATDEPGSEEPGTDVPGTDVPGAEEPGTEEPGAEDPGTEEPGSEEPGSEEPGIEGPGAEKPGAEEPGTEEPGAETPGSEEPGAEEPGTEEPGAETPGYEEPGAEEPGVVGPRMPVGTTVATSFWDARTASGKPMRYRTLASPYWPLGTKVRITYGDRSAIGYVEDFGPAQWAVRQHRPPAIVDLSEKMMQRLTGRRSHAVKVKFEVLRWGKGRRYKTAGIGYALAMGDHDRARPNKSADDR